MVAERCACVCVSLVCSASTYARLCPFSLLPSAPTLHSLAKMRFWYLRWVFDTILSMTCSIHKAACLSSFVCCVILYIYETCSPYSICAACTCLASSFAHLRVCASVCVCVIVWVSLPVCAVLVPVGSCRRKNLYLCAVRCFQFIIHSTQERWCLNSLHWQKLLKTALK